MATRFVNSPFQFAAPATISLALEAFTNKNSAVTDWTTAHTFASDDNLLIVGFGHEQNATPTVVLDPAGINVSVTEIVSLFGDSNTSWGRLYGAFNFMPLTGSKNIVPTFSAVAAGSIGIWTFKNATRLPTTGDFDSDNGAPSANSLALSLAIAGGEESGIILTALNVNATEGMTAGGGLTEVHENQGATGGQTVAFGRNSGPLSNPEAPSVSWTSIARCALVGVKCV